MRDDRRMRLPAGWRPLGHLWRFGLVVLGVVLIASAIENAADGSASWSLFAVGAASGVSIAVVALYWPRLLARGRSGVLGVDVTAYGAGCGALLTVVVLVGRYGAATGAFLLLTGLTLIETARRRRQAERRR
jgi:hypothetical protein